MTSSLVRKKEIIPDGTVTKSDVKSQVPMPSSMSVIQDTSDALSSLGNTILLALPASPSLLPIHPLHCPEDIFRHPRLMLLVSRVRGLQRFPVASRMRPNSLSLSLPSSTACSNTTLPWSQLPSVPETPSPYAPDLCTQLWATLAF